MRLFISIILFSFINLSYAVQTCNLCGKPNLINALQQAQKNGTIEEQMGCVSCRDRVISVQEHDRRVGLGKSSAKATKLDKSLASPEKVEKLDPNERNAAEGFSTFITANRPSR